MRMQKLFLDENSEIDAYLVVSSINRQYLTGFKSSFGVLAATKDRCIFATDPRYEIAAKAKLEESAEVFVSNRSGCYERVKNFFEESGVKTVAVEFASLTHLEYIELSMLLEGLTLVDASQKIDELRRIKSVDEIAAIEKAQTIAGQAFLKLQPQIKPGISERELQAELEYILMKLGGECTSFDSIVAFGANSAKPHATPSDKRLETNEIVLLDYGTKVNGYCADITRTLYVGKNADEFKLIYDIVKKAGEYAIKNIKPGMTAREADSYAREFITANGYGDKFNHSLGHGVGLEVHEGIGMSPVSNDVLKAGMVVSVEPGIYIQGYGGVRIEDLIVITETGTRNLTAVSKEMIIL